MYKLFLLIGLTFLNSLDAGDIGTLPLYDEDKVRLKEDWLVAPINAKSKLYRSADNNKLILSNGIVSRTWYLSPNAATIGFKHLQSGEEFIRSIKPEAFVSINGKKINIGGLHGLPIHNFIKEEWLGSLKTETSSFKFTSFKTGPTEAPFRWKKRPQWLSTDSPWPAPGLRLTMTYTQSSEADKILDDNFEKSRKIVFSDDISGTSLSAGWKEVSSPFIQNNHPTVRSSYVNEGKAGEVMTLSNCIAYGERKLPAKFTAIECRVDPGTDNSADWGPGMVAVWPNGKTIKFQLRPGQNTFAYTHKKGLCRVGKLEKGKVQFLRMSFESGKIYLHASTDYVKWHKLATIKNSDSLPSSIRLGKTGSNGADGELTSEPGDVVRCRVDRLRVYGDVKKINQNEIYKLTQKLNLAPALTVDIIYEIYDGTPIICKSFKLHNNTDQSIRIDSFKAEILAVAEAESSVGPNPDWSTPNMFVFADMNFGGMDQKGANDCVKWLEDRAYKSQVNYPLETPCLLEVAPPLGPDVSLPAAKTFESFRVFEMLNDSWDRQRLGLSKCRFFRTLAPWSQENPIIMHVKKADEKSLKLAIDQAAEVGFEMVIMTFGSGFNAENNKPDYLKYMKKMADYAHSKGIALGGYSHLSGRSAGKTNDVTGAKPRFNKAPCIGSQWGHDYFKKLEKLFNPNEIGLDILEHDGSYPGDSCDSTSHPFHGSYANSQWAQWIRIRDYYRLCRGMGVYLNVPDYYYLNGSSKCGMGYREVNWSLPRKEQELIERQNIYDGTWNKTPTMGWMFVPLVQYHGGGAAATIEPLKDHIPHYEQRMANLFGAGVQACYRGPRLYDTEETKAAVKKWTLWYKKHRAILDSDIIHLRRADGRDLDYILHVNPKIKEKGLLMVYNPLSRSVVKTIKVPLYYSGLTKDAAVIDKNGKEITLSLARDYSVELKVEIEAYGTAHYVFEAK